MLAWYSKTAIPCAAAAINAAARASPIANAERTFTATYGCSMASSAGPCSSISADTCS